MRRCQQNLPRGGCHRLSRRQQSVLCRALAFDPADLSTPPPSVPLSGYEIFVEVRSRRRDNAVVFACEGRFTDDDADLPLACDNSVLGPPDFSSTLRLGDRVISTDNFRLTYHEGGAHLVLGLHLVLDVMLVRCTDGAVCNFVHDDLAFFSSGDHFDYCDDHTTHLTTTVLGIVLSPAASHRDLELLHGRIALDLKFDTSWTQARITPRVHLNGTMEDHDSFLSAEGAAHALEIAELSWVASPGDNYAERLRLARLRNPPVAVSVGPEGPYSTDSGHTSAEGAVDAVPAKIWPTRPPPCALDGYYAMVRVRDHRYTGDQACFYSSGALTEDLVASDYNEKEGFGRGQIFHNVLGLPYAEVRRLPLDSRPWILAR